MGDRKGERAGVSRREIVAVSLGSLLFALVFCFPIVARLGHPGLGDDWDQHLVFHWVPYRTVVEWKQLPLWNPYLCGGTPMLGNPQSRILTPFFLLHLALGPLLALRIEIILHLALLVAGCYALARVVGLGRLGSAASASVFGGCSAHYLHVGVGHSWALSYAYVPWAIALLLLAIERHRLTFAALAGLVLALMVNEGGIYPAPHAGLLAVVVCVTVAVIRREVWPLKALAVTAVAGALFSGAKLLPTYELMRDHQRLIASDEFAGPDVLRLALFSLDQDRHRVLPTDHPLWGWHEYGAYVGIIAFGFAVIGALSARRRSVVWTIGALFFLVLAVGTIPSAKALSPWWLLHRLPFFASMHVPSRFLVMAVLCLALLAGFGVERVGAWHRRGPWIAAGLVALSTALAFWVGPPNLKYAFAKPDEPVAAVPAFQQHYAADFWGMLALARSNQGALNCYDFTHVDTAAIGANQPGYRGEQYLEGDGEVRLTRWSPNVLEYDVRVPAATTLVVNQNFHPPWQLAEGTGTVAAHSGLISVDLPAGPQHLVLEYVSPGFRIGVVMALLGLGGLVLLHRREKNARRTSAVSSTPSPSPTSLAAP